MQQILVVEDEPTASDVVARYLRRDGCIVGIAVGGEEGLRRALEERPDLIVLDQLLLRLDGLELCRRLRTTSTASSSDSIGAMNPGPASTAEPGWAWPSPAA